MISMKHVFGALMLALLASVAFAQSETQVTIQPADDTGRVLNISVLVFQPAVSTSGTTSQQRVNQWYQECRTQPNVQQCMSQKALEANEQSRDYQFNFSSIQNAHFVVEYFNPQGNAYRGLWSPVPGCDDVVADREGTAYVPSREAGGALTQYTYYYGQCDLTPVTQGARTYVRVTFVPRPEDPYQQSSAEYEFNNANVTAATQFAQNVQNFINGVSTSGGQGIGAGGALPCVALFMIMGLLMASLYFAGKSPVSLLDITTPKLPTPKGVTASGQILAPFGYTEMKRTTGDKMREAAKAASLSSGILQNQFRGDSEFEQARRAARSASGTAADRAAGAGAAGVAQQRAISEAFVTGAKAAGMRGDDLRRLANLPYHWGDAEHRTAAQVIAALEGRGGREALLAMTLKDYLYSMRAFQTLETLTGHPEIGKRSAMHYRLTNTLGKFYGANRYAILSGVVMAGTDSTVRTARVMGRMSKAIVTEAPHLARSTARTTMEMLGGKHAVEELEAKARTSPTAAWLSGQLQKHPSQVVVGAMFPINDKMSHLYRTLHNEAMRDEMRYVLRQLYKKMGVRFDISEQELASMGHLDMDILKRSNLHASAELAAAEGEIRKVLANSAMSSQEKLSSLMRVAETYGAHLDHQMLTFSQRLQSIETSAQPDHIKMLSLQQALEEQNRVKMAARGGGRVSEDAYVCHVGGEAPRGSQVWETMVLRTMIWDAENGYLRGGLKEELLSARLNVANRLTGLIDIHDADPGRAAAKLAATMDQLPEHMRDATQLRKVAERNRQDLLALFEEPARAAFDQYSTKKQWSVSMERASIAQLVDFMQGGNIARIGDMDPKTGRMTWRASDKELELPKNLTKVDLARHWVPALDSRENFAIGQWVESRFTKSYVPAFKQSIEAELNRTAGSSSWTVEQRGQQAKKLWIADQLMQDMEQRFNSHFGQNTYGTTRETTRFYAGIISGFMEKALQEKGLDANHPDRMFLDKMDMSNPKHVAKLKEMMEAHKEAYQRVISRDMTYDEIARSNKAVVMLHEGGYAYYKKGMMLSDYDRVMAGETALRDEKGVLRKFIPEEVPVKFAGRDDLQQQFYKVRGSKDVNEWQPFVDSTLKWAKEGGYNYEKEKVLASVLWQYCTTTHDYDRFWKESAVSVEAKRQVAPVAPSVLRFFGADGHTMSGVVKPFRDLGMHGGDYISKVALAAGGDLHKASYDITPVSSQLRMHSFKLASQIQSGEMLKGLTAEEQAAYRAVAAQHGAYIQVWQYAIDRNPWRTSTSFGTHQAWASYFHFGPAVPFSVKDNLRAYMGKGEYMNFIAHAGFSMDLAGKMMRPYIGMLRGMQMSMQGYASKWDSTGDALRQWNYTEPRVQEAMQSLNPFSFKWFAGKNSSRVAKLNVIGGSLERHQLSGHDYLAGLRQAPQDIFLQKKGVYANARTEDFNPGETIGDYRMKMHADAPMAEYLFRAKEAAYLYDKDLYKDAMDNTTRRTVSAEALAIRRDQELRGFGVLQNSLFGWANPLGFLWHMPMPLFPQSATPKEIVAKYVARSKHGHGQSFGDSMKQMAEGIGKGASKMFQPHKMSMVVYCPKCGMSNYRGSMCKNLSCRQALY
ncbi:MAG: hypothetical protein AB1529_04080 [Candidatus Micrarchaeota archaeon]